MSTEQSPPPVLDPDTWYTGEQIAQVRPFARYRWLKRQRENGTLPYAKTGGQTSPCLYRLRDIDALMDARVVPATNGPLAGAK